MEAIATHTQTVFENPVAILVAPRPTLQFILGRPQASGSIQTLWNHFRLSHAWGEVSQMYDLEACE